jgi:hypothetical protein
MSAYDPKRTSVVVWQSNYVMVVKIRALCVTCISLAAVNVLVLWQLWR